MPAHRPPHCWPSLCAKNPQGRFRNSHFVMIPKRGMEPHRLGGKTQVIVLCFPLGKGFQIVHFLCTQQVNGLGIRAFLLGTQLQQPLPLHRRLGSETKQRLRRPALLVDDIFQQCIACTAVGNGGIRLTHGRPIQLGRLSELLFGIVGPENIGRMPVPKIVTGQTLIVDRTG